MENQQIFSRIDHTLLKATSSWDEIKALCVDAMRYKTASVCIPPSYCERVKKEFPELTVCTVIGFPLGYQTTETKVFETKNAIQNGADEVDMVIDIGDVKNGDFEKVLTEIRMIRQASTGKILKVIIEACYLTEDEKQQLCRIVTEAGADFIKTSTGFGTSGATLEDIALFKENIGSSVRMKAAGGIKTKEDLIAFVEAGCERIGTSSGIQLLTQGGESKGY